MAQEELMMKDSVWCNSERYCDILLYSPCRNSSVGYLSCYSVFSLHYDKAEALNPNENIYLLAEPLNYDQNKLVKQN